MTETPDALAADIRLLDGEIPEAAASNLAEALSARGWSKFPEVYTNPATGLLTQLRPKGVDEGMTAPSIIDLAIQFQTELAEALLKVAALKAAQDKGAPALSLASFNIYDSVEVMREGVWIPGKVYTVGPAGVGVETERGPVTIGALTRIRFV